MKIRFFLSGRQMHLIKLLLLLCIITSACKKDSDTKTTNTSTGIVTFYINPPNPLNSTFHLMIDGVDKGDLPFAYQAPGCGATSGYPTFTLTVGSHSFEAKSMNGYAWGNGRMYNVTSGCQVIKVIR